MKLKLHNVDHLVVFLDPKYIFIDKEIELSDSDAHKLLEKHSDKLVKVEEKHLKVEEKKPIAIAKAKVMLGVKDDSQL